MNKNELRIKLRTKKLGLLIYDARLSAKRSIKECAEIMGISRYQYKAFESGEQTPSLPQLEALAYYLNLPLEHFWGNEILSELNETEESQIENLFEDREQEIGAFLSEKRNAVEISLEQLAETTSISEEMLFQYEMGKTPIPLAELEVIARELNIFLPELFEKCGSSGSLRAQQSKIENFTQMPQELQEFLCKPVNKPYIELAHRLSQMSSDKLRNIAESLLEITY